MKGRTQSTGTSAAVVDSRDELYSVLSAEPRRDALAVLLREGPELTESRLAAAVAAREAGTSVDDLAEEVRRDAQVGVRHVHLPKLESAGLVGWSREEGDVELLGGELLRQNGLEPVVRGLADAPAEVVSTTFSLLADGRRRVILTVLKRAGALDTEELATRVVAREQVGKVTEAKTERVAASLKHVHLPRLEEAGVVDIDDDDVVYRGNALLDGSDLL